MRAAPEILGESFEYARGEGGSHLWGRRGQCGFRGEVVVGLCRRRLWLRLWLRLRLRLRRSF
ncbi:hypothetical protein [Streptomyces sp. NPDC056525]|uniref:hypothetical protein n=1 Tax=unclassified Streptomyces TaxID=2593676 RepID=UPI0036CBED59